MQTEDLLMLSCAMRNIKQDTLKKVQEILSPDLNWAYFLQRTKEEGLASLIYKAFLKIPDIEKIIPEYILQDLKIIYYSVVKRNILISRTLEKILQAFQAENIESIIFKGIALAESVYGDIGSRSMVDLDILVRRQDVKKADEILGRFNYAKLFEVKDYSAIFLNLYRNALLFRNLNTYPQYIHLYWHILNLFTYDKDILHKIDMDKIWDDAIEIELGNLKIRTFSIYHQIIYLCLHASNHAYKPLILLCDLNEFIRLNQEKIDWDILAKEAVKFGLSKYVYYGLYLTRQTLGAAIPENTFSRLKPKRISIFERKFISSVLEGKSASAREGLVYLAMIETLSDRLYFARRALFPSRYEMALVRQKDASQINIFDYVRRINSAFNSAAKALFY